VTVSTDGLSGNYQASGAALAYCSCLQSEIGGGGTPIPVAVSCATPTNFRQNGAGINNSGTLTFNYNWSSTSGYLADLAACTMGEIVTYNPSNLPFPSPPFPAGLNPANPTITNFSASSGAAQDNHSTPGTFVKPYSQQTVVATQYYRYSCPCQNNGAYVNVVGPLSISRSVTSNGAGGWEFVITKPNITPLSGASNASINPLP
jgi:hypothetical protein